MFPALKEMWLKRMIFEKSKTYLKDLLIKKDFHSEMISWIMLCPKLYLFIYNRISTSRPVMSHSKLDLDIFQTSAS